MNKGFDLAGRGVIVTGGNGGIGYGMARALLAAGAQVAISQHYGRVSLSSELGRRLEREPE